MSFFFPRIHAKLNTVVESLTNLVLTLNKAYNNLTGKLDVVDDNVDNLNHRLTEEFAGIHKGGKQLGENLYTIQREGQRYLEQLTQNVNALRQDATVRLGGLNDQLSNMHQTQQECFNLLADFKSALESIDERVTTNRPQVTQMSPGTASSITAAMRSQAHHIAETRCEFNNRLISLEEKLSVVLNHVTKEPKPNAQIHPSLIQINKQLNQDSQTQADQDSREQHEQDQEQEANQVLQQTHQQELFDRWEEDDYHIRKC